MRKNERMEMTKENWKSFKNAKCCYICNGEFKDNEIKKKKNCWRS